jgi:branched-chain amino acid aminotransferase
VAQGRETVMSGDDKLAFRLEPHAAPVATEERTAQLVSPGFGRVFTDHMAVVRYSEDRGWHDATIQARSSL